MALQVFRFKQFALQHGGETWSIGTDSILLGSWCSVDEQRYILDVGTGCGVLGFMAAQRNPHAMISGIDILPGAIDVALRNLSLFPLPNELSFQVQDIRWLMQNEEPQYDLIICNPPYYPDGIQSINPSRKAARQGAGFSLWDLPGSVVTMLGHDGILATVVPSASAFRFIEIANAHGLWVRRRLSVRHTHTVENAIELLELQKQRGLVQNEALVLYHKGGHATEEFTQLCGEFLWPE